MINDKADLNILNDEINSLRTKLSDINRDKEAWFKKKEELKKEMLVLIEKIKVMQKGDDTFQVDKLKNERDKYNSQVRELITRIGELKKEKRNLLQKYGIHEDPEKIKKTIERIEEKIETEALSIDKEKKLMEQIKRMKKDYGALGGVKLISDKINEISKDIDETKNKANETHEKLKKVLKEKRTWYKELFSLSRQINAIKKQQEKAFEMFISFKNSFIDVSRQLSSKLNLIKKEKQKIIEKKELKKEREQEKKRLIIEEKRKRTQEKLTKGEKLTTEDILAMQGKEDEEKLT